MDNFNEHTMHHLSNLDDPKQFIADYNKIMDLLKPIETEHKKADHNFKLEKFWTPVFNNKAYTFKVISYQNYIGITNQVQRILDTYHLD